MDELKFKLIKTYYNFEFFGYISTICKVDYHFTSVPRSIINICCDGQNLLVISFT